MATITGRTVISALPSCDTPGVATASPGNPGSLARTTAEASWRAVTPLIAGTPHVRISKDGGRTYPARHARPLSADPPGQPCTVPVYDPGAGTGRMLALDLDPARCAAVTEVTPRAGVTDVTGGCDTRAAEIRQLLDRLGARYVADVSPSGGRHILVLFSSALPWRELRDVARAFARRLPAVDPAPMSSLGGQISPPGARHKSGGWRLLSMPLSEATTAVGCPNGPEVWAALLAELAAELRQVDPGPVDTRISSAAELDDTGDPWVPRLGGRAPLGADLEHAARSGRWDRSRYAGRSEARMAILGAAAARGWRLAEVQSAVACGAWKGLAALYERRSEPGAPRAGSCPASGEKPSTGSRGRKTYAIGTLATSAHAPRQADRRPRRSTD